MENAYQTTVDRLLEVASFHKVEAEQPSQSDNDLKPWLPVAHLATWQIKEAVVNCLGHMGNTARKLVSPDGRSTVGSKPSRGYANSSTT
jgi:hypothetical protein